MKIVSVAQMRALEAAAFAAGISEARLQQRAGHAVAREVFRLLSPGERVVVLVGHGNNGRDGAIAAEWLVRHRVGVDVVLAPRHAVTSEELARLQVGGASLIPAHQTRAGSAALQAASVALDALSGIGLRGALREPLDSLVKQLNDARAGLHVLALDVPSGVDADSGAVPGPAVWADSTVTLGAVKQGLLLFPAAERVGRLIPADIGIPPPIADADLPYAVLGEDDLGRRVPGRPLGAHKYRFGRVLVMAGSDHFLGAPVLASGGAARVGAGLVTVASTRDARLTVAAHQPEATFTQHDVSAADGASAARSLEPYLRSHNAVVLGPGLGRSDGITAFVREILRLRPREHRLVVDADGLVALSEIADWPALLDANVALTPHSGELERLVGHALDPATPIWVQARQFAATWGCVLVAKGPFTCVAGPDGRVDVWAHANPALATGGTGDVLAGMTGGVLAQDIEMLAGASLAVGMHGLAAERVTAQRHWRTLLASDLLLEVPAVLEALRPRKVRR